MDFVELYQRAMREDGLSANFNGLTNKTRKKMGKKLIEGKSFGFVVTNNTAEDLCYALIRGTMPNLAEIKKRYPQVMAILADGDFYTGTEDKKAKCSCRGGSSIAFFQEFFASIPGNVVTLDMTSTEKENFYTEVEVGTPNPCNIEPLSKKALSDYLGTQQYDQNRVIAKGINIPLSAAHLVLLTVKAGSTVTYNFTINTMY